MTSGTATDGQYAILVTGAAALQLDASPRPTRARILGDLSTVAEAAAQVASRLAAKCSELCLSEGAVLWRIEVDHRAHRVRLLEIRRPWPGHAERQGR